MIGRVIVFLAAAVFTSVFFINLCATIFQWGCQSLWGAADRFCNIRFGLRRRRAERYVELVSE